MNPDMKSVWRDCPDQPQRPEVKREEASADALRGLPSELNWLRGNLKAAFRENPSEPGTGHPAADGIILALRSTLQNIEELTAAADRRGNDAYLAWDIVIRITHVDLPWLDDAKANPARQALQSTGPMVRDGAVQIAED